MSRPTWPSRLDRDAFRGIAALTKAAANLKPDNLRTLAERIAVEVISGHSEGRQPGEVYFPKPGLFTPSRKRKRP